MICRTKSEIRIMDNIMRQANNAYPRISPYRVSTQFQRKNFTPHYIQWLDKIGRIVDLERMKSQWESFFNIILSSTKALKTNRLGDCGESSALMMSALLANGYKDGKIARLFFEAEARDLVTEEVVGKKLIDTTHELVVKNVSPEADSSNPKTYGKNMIIIDGWDGFCSNMQEGFNRYYEMFLSGMRKWINKEANVEITYKPQLHFLNFDKISDKEIERFKIEFPELIRKKSQEDTKL